MTTVEEECGLSHQDIHCKNSDALPKWIDYPHAIVDLPIVYIPHPALTARLTASGSRAIIFSSTRAAPAGKREILVEGEERIPPVGFILFHLLETEA